MDPIFEQEQQHLTETYAQLEDIAEAAQASIEARMKEALGDKADMLDELAVDFGNDVDVETYVEIEAIHKIIDDINLANDMDTDRLRKAQLLMKQPYFAKVSLVYKPGAEPKDVYIGTCGMTNDASRHFIIDWRSPVAEVYYNQHSGKTSYEANGRTIECELVCRRQFNIERVKLNAYFDTTIAIEDALLLASLSRERSDKLTDITATIQREQNQVVRHEDVPVLLVSGIAGSGKTSVLLQRIAYLLFQQRETLSPKDVYLITPNPVFERYISDVLPSMGEQNPTTMTWDELMASLGLSDRGLGKDSSTESLESIDALLEHVNLEQRDFTDIMIDDERVITAKQARAAWDNYSQFPTGSHRSALAVEDLLERLSQRISRLACDEDWQNLVSELDEREQLEAFGQQVCLVEEDDLKEYTRRYLEKRYAGIEQRILDGEWLRLERIGMHMLGKESLTSAELLYLRLAIMGGGQRSAKYVMIDEVQDYSAPQLKVLARYFENAHFLLLGDENQAIREHTATFSDIRRIFTASHAEVCQCDLMTSYRSSPEITALFTKLMAPDERMRTSSVQREGTEPVIAACSSEASYREALRASVVEANTRGGLAAVIVAHGGQLKKVEPLLEGLEYLKASESALPSSGVVLMDVAQAKGLEFDEVIVADAQASVYRNDIISRHRLYTALSRATQRLTVIACGDMTPLL